MEKNHLIDLKQFEIFYSIEYGQIKQIKTLCSLKKVKEMKIFIFYYKAWLIILVYVIYQQKEF